MEKFRNNLEKFDILRETGYDGEMFVILLIRRVMFENKNRKIFLTSHVLKDIKRINGK